MILAELFVCFMEIGLCSVGGGYTAISLIQSIVVERHGWITMEEFADLVAIAEMTPGPIGINAATFAGMRVGGLPGALAASLGCVAPAVIICSFLAYIYYRYRKVDILRSVLSSLRPVVVAIVAASGLSILSAVIFGGGEISLAGADMASVALFICAFAAMRLFKAGPIKVMLACGAVGVICELIGVGL